MRRIIRDEFYRRIRKLHRSRYQYDESSYRHSRSMIRIKCPVHGWFEQLAANHGRGCGCPRCASEEHRLDTEEFIRQSATIHKGKYNYSEVEYTVSQIPVTIICPKHGRFSQLAYSHLEGNGCLSCGVGKDNYSETTFNQYPVLRSTPGRLYLIRFDLPEQSFLKIGVTIDSITRRWRGWIRQISILADIQMGIWKAYQMEQKIIRDYSAYSYDPHISGFGGRTECFVVTQADSILQRIQSQND